MEALMVQGNNLDLVERVVNQLGDYVISKVVKYDEPKVKAIKSTAGTCRECEYWAYQNDRVNWGKCRYYEDSAINGNHKQCEHCLNINVKEA